MEENNVKNKVERPQNKHLKPLKKGETANPNGRPLGQKNYATLYREALIKLAKLNDKEPEELELEILSKGIMNARSGDYRFYKDVLDRIHGQATQNSEVNVTGLTISFDTPFKKDAPDITRKTKDNSSK